MCKVTRCTQPRAIDIAPAGSGINLTSDISVIFRGAVDYRSGEILTASVVLALKSHATWPHEQMMWLDVARVSLVFVDLFR